MPAGVLATADASADRARLPGAPPLRAGARQSVRAAAGPAARGRGARAGPGAGAGAAAGRAVAGARRRARAAASAAAHGPAAAARRAGQWHGAATAAGASRWLPGALTRIPQPTARSCRPACGTSRVECLAATRRPWCRAAAAQRARFAELRCGWVAGVPMGQQPPHALIGDAGSHVMQARFERWRGVGRRNRGSSAMPHVVSKNTD